MYSVWSRGRCHYFSSSSLHAATVLLVSISDTEDQCLHLTKTSVV
jgi:hypothetical protein